MVAKHDLIADLAIFLTEKTGSCCGTWTGRLTADRQRAMFGRFLGKGTIVVDGAHEEIRHRRKVCFGLDWDDNVVLPWRDIAPAEPKTSRSLK